MNFENSELAKTFNFEHKEEFNLAKGEYFDEQRMNKF